MGSIYNQQGLLTITLETGINLAGATDCKILYAKPTGVKGSWPASIFETTKLRYEVGNPDLDEYGVWSFQTSFIIGGRLGLGEILTREVKENLKTV